MINDDMPDSIDSRPPPPWLYRKAMLIEAPLAGLVGMTCRDFARLSVTRLDRSLSPGENVRYRMHGLMCSVCRGFSRQFEQINRLLHEASVEADDAPAPADIEDSASRVRERVLNRLS